MAKTDHQFFVYFELFFCNSFPVSFSLSFPKVPATLYYSFVQNRKRHLPKQHLSWSGKLGKNTHSGSEVPCALLAEPLVAKHKIHNQPQQPVSPSAPQRQSLRGRPGPAWRAGGLLVHTEPTCITPGPKPSSPALPREKPACFWYHHIWLEDKRFHLPQHNLPQASGIFHLNHSVSMRSRLKPPSSDSSPLEG